jgi:MoxR-like ATPase
MNSATKVDIQAVTEKVKREGAMIQKVLEEIGNSVVGQKNMLEKLLIGMLADGHVLLEGVPGLAKTTAVKAMANAVNCHFNRIQFTPDLLPADLIGTLIFNPKSGEFHVKKGPIFANIILADEIRGPRCSLCWRPRTRWNRKAPIPCRKPRSIASCSRSP